MSEAAWVLAIDPGDLHVGWAKWFRYGPQGRSTLEAGEWDAEEAPDRVEEMLSRGDAWPIPRLLVLEEFRLYEHKAAEQSWQPMLTAEMIGALKWIARQHDVPWVEQGAGILKPMQAQLEARGIGLTQAGPHAKSAQTHLWYRLLKDEYVERRAS